MPRSSAKVRRQVWYVIMAAVRWPLAICARMSAT